MNQSPLFSVLIANYNNAQYLREALESVYNQTYSNWEIIIVDDGSTDTSLEIYETLQGQSRIHILKNEENKGTGYTKARCVEMANGELCAFLDPDDAIVPEALMEMVTVHSKYENIGIVHSRAYYCDEKLNIQSEGKSARDIPQNDPFFFNLESSISHFSSFKNAFYKKTDGINPFLKRAIDQDLYLKLYEISGTHYLNQLLYYYRIHTGGISTTTNVDKANFWHWVVIMDAARRRNINVESLFVENFVRRTDYDTLNRKYLKVQKFEKINNFLGNIKRKFSKK